MEDSNDQFEYFASFQTKENADDYVKFLAEHSIPYKLDTSTTLITEAIVGTAVYPKITLKILGKDFKRVNDLVAESVRQQAAENLEDYYLNELSTEELHEILEKQEEWSTQDVIMAKVILEHRGEEITAEELEAKRAATLEQQRQGKNASWALILSYFAMIVIGIVTFEGIFMLAGGGMGWYFWKGKEADMDGNRHYTYDAVTRNRGYWMLMIGIVLTFVWICSLLKMSF